MVTWMERCVEEAATTASPPSEKSSSGMNGHKHQPHGLVNGVAPKDIPLQLDNSELFICEAFVDGKWMKKSNRFPVCDPATEEQFSEVASLDRDDFKLAIASAAKAQKTFYQTTTGPQRGRMLMQWYQAIMNNAKDLARILCLENGKTLAEAEGEITYAASFVHWFAEEASRTYGDVIPSSTPNTTVMTILQPVGVCGIITPWNFPAAMITRKVAPALAAGCACVIKPPSETPHTALAITKLAVEAGIPAGCLQVCPTRDRAATLELVTNPLVKKISFTGSTGVGKMLVREAASTLKKVSMELGGNAPFIVFNDADLDLAIEGVMICKFRCSGQTCVCANRILVQSGVLPEFTKRLVIRVKQLKCGAGCELTSTQGPLVNRAAVDKVTAHVEDAVKLGAKIQIGGTQGSGKGFFFHPTVMTGVTREMKVANDETFGPLAAIMSFETEDEAIELANNTEFGLAGYFFSRDVGRVLRVASKLECGMVGVNTGKISAAETPFGGILESGYGREGSKYGMAEYMVMKAITIGNTNV